jgi:hypothetical protein
MRFGITASTLISGNSTGSELTSRLTSFFTDFSAFREPASTPFSASKSPITATTEITASFMFFLF